MIVNCSGDSFVFHHVIFLCYSYLMYISEWKIWWSFLVSKRTFSHSLPLFQEWYIYTKHTITIKGIFRYPVITYRIIYFGEREREMPNEEIFMNLKDMMGASRIKSIPKYQPLDTIQLNWLINSSFVWKKIKRMVWISVFGLNGLNKAWKIQWFFFSLLFI